MPAHVTPRATRRTVLKVAPMGIRVHSDDGVAEIVVDFPPVNALPAGGWFDLADAVAAAGADPEVRAVVLAAEGRGFCAGVDIKEMQRTPGTAR